MAFPGDVRAIIGSDEDAAWPVQDQGRNECGCASAANALNLLEGRLRYDKDDFVREAGIFFQRDLGGTPSPLAGWLVKRHGYGTHFGNLRFTDPDVVLRDLVDRRVPVIVEIGANKVGPFTIYGQHAIVLVGYRASPGGATREFYFVDSEYPAPPAPFNPRANQVTIDGVVRRMPGNRTISRDDFFKQFVTGIYLPVFRTQAEHDAWYWTNIRPTGGVPIFSWIYSALVTGSNDVWVGTRPAVALGATP